MLLHMIQAGVSRATKQYQNNMVLLCDVAARKSALIISPLESFVVFNVN